MARKSLFSDRLRRAVSTCGKTRYRISIETGISESILSRFVNKGAGLSLANVDKLCECIGAELVLKPVSRNHHKGK
jgi:DNA-binding Xre family transcriptional regulator